MKTSVVCTHDRICGVFVTADVVSLHGERVRMQLIIQLVVHLLYRSVTDVFHVCYCGTTDNTQRFYNFHSIFFPNTYGIMGVKMICNHFDNFWM